MKIHFTKTERKNMCLWMLVFDEVVKQGSFTAASNTLFLTKSGVSQHVSRLEKHLGVQLLIRSTRGLNLTSAGEKVFHRSNQLKRLLADTVDEISAIKKNPTGFLTISAPRSLIPIMVVPALKKLVGQFPDIRPRLIVDDGYQNIVKSGIDIAVRIGALDDSDLIARRVGGYTEIFVASSEYIASLDSQITRENITKYPFVATCWQSPNRTHHFIDQENNSHDISLVPSYEVNCANTVIDMVMAGMGIGLLPKLYVKKFFRAEGLRHVLVDLETRPDDIHCVHAYKKSVPLKVEWCLKYLLGEEH